MHDLRPATYLLSDPRSRQILHQRAVSLAKTAATTLAQAEATVEFSLGVERYALALRQVAEITRYSQVTPIPGSAPELLGAIFVRGEVYCVMDLATILGVTHGDENGREGFILLVWFKGKKIGLKVDAVQQISMQPKLSEQPGAGIIGVKGNYSLGMLGTALISIDLDAVLAHPAFNSGR